MPERHDEDAVRFVSLLELDRRGNATPSDPKAPKGRAVPKKYHSPATSGLEVEVGAAAIPFDIKLASK